MKSKKELEKALESIKGFQDPKIKQEQYQTPSHIAADLLWNAFMIGDIVDKKVIDWLISEFKRTDGVDLSNDRTTVQRLREAAEKAKCELSSPESTEINLPFITADASGPKHLVMTLTRAKLEQMTQALVERTVGPCKHCLNDSGLDVGQINQVVLVGGQTRMPAVQEAVKKIFGKEPNKGVNPDEVVAVGAAIQGGVLAGDVSDILLLDVTPLSLGIETLGGVMTKLIERNTTIPAKKSEIFSTAADNQNAVTVRVLQGERQMASDNRLLGNFNLEGIPPAPRGVPQIEVTFDIDANGIVHVSAKDLGTGKEQKIRIESSSGISKEEVENFVKEAESHAEEDKKKHDLVQSRNMLDNLTYQSEKSLKEHGDKVSAEEKSNLESAIKDAKQALETNDVDSIKSATEKLTTASHPIGQKIYEASQQKTSPQGEQAPHGEPNPESEPKKKSEKQKDDVVDADYEVVDGDEK